MLRHCLWISPRCSSHSRRSICLSGKLESWSKKEISLDKKEMLLGKQKCFPMTTDKKRTLENAAEGTTVHSLSQQLQPSIRDICNLALTQEPWINSEQISRLGTLGGKLICKSLSNNQQSCVDKERCIFFISYGFLFQRHQFGSRRDQIIATITSIPSFWCKGIYLTQMLLGLRNYSILILE